MHRGFHNMTARFNGYYWSTEAIKEGVYKIEKSHKEDYEKLLPVFIVPDNESAKATFPEFDKAIKKSSLVIQRHTIRDKKDNEIPVAGKWIDNNWNNIGIARYYKREFFSGIEALDYVIRTYKTKDRYIALLWSARSYNEIGAVSQTEPIFNLLNNDKKLPKNLKIALMPIKGDYYIKRGLYNEAAKQLTEASKLNRLKKGFGRKERARYAFIAAQLYEKEKDSKKARQLYSKVIDLKPAYDMVFYAKIKQARMFDVKKDNMTKTKQNLLKMAKDSKNSDYLDVIYYTLGEIEEKEKHINVALTYYKKSSQSSTFNVNQKAMSFLKLGELNFDLTNYALSGAYYDSTVAVLKNDHPEYNSIIARKKTLETLVGYITTIQREDSLQRLAKMSESERNKAIDRIIAKIKEDEERKKEELENALNSTQNTNLNSNNTSSLSTSNNDGGWYFYNQTTISFGISDFVKRWGNRKLEKNWRRSQKGLSNDDGNKNNNENNNNVVNNTLGNKNESAAKSPEYYLSQLPLNDSLMKVSHAKIVEADYMLGFTYKEDLRNNKKAIEAFEDLNNRYTNHKYKLNCYYQLYRIYEAEKNKNQSDFYKQKLLTEYPNSEYSKLIKNPEYAKEISAQRSEVETFYTSTYEIYVAGNYEEAETKCTEASSTFGKNEFTPKFEFIRALCTGKLKGIDSLEASLQKLTILYPKSEVTPKANEILLAIKKQKNPESNIINPSNKPVTDTFNVNFESEHFAVIITPDDPKTINPFKSSIDNFNRSFFSNKNFSITSNLFGQNQQMVIIKSFTNAKEAQTYIESLKNDSKVYSGGIKKDDLFFFILSTENMQQFYKKANAKSYKTFYEEAYKSLFSSKAN